MVNNLEKIKQIDRDLNILIGSCEGEEKPVSIMLEILLRNLTLLLSLTIAQGKLIDSNANSDDLLAAIGDDITNNVNNLVNEMTEPKAAGVKFDA